MKNNNRNNNTGNQAMPQAANMHYLFNIDYFEPLTNDNASYSNKNSGLKNFRFEPISQIDDWKKMKSYRFFTLKTTYPGLLMGTGNLHSINEKEVIKNGFSFDYVNGLPYLPGSSLKGIIRSCFPKDKEDSNNQRYKEYIQELLGGSELDIDGLRDHIFNNKDIFLGAYPSFDKKRTLLDFDYITPHSDELKNPIPIQILKVRPNIKFEFGFILHDYVVDDQVILTAEEKLNLFQNCLLDMGIGAKTNVGYGNLVRA